MQTPISWMRSLGSKVKIASKAGVVTAPRQRSFIEGTAICERCPKQPRKWWPDRSQSRHPRQLHRAGKKMGLETKKEWLSTSAWRPRFPASMPAVTVHSTMMGITASDFCRKLWNRRALVSNRRPGQSGIHACTCGPDLPSA